MENMLLFTIVLCIIAAGWDIYSMIWNIKRKNYAKSVIFLFLFLLMVYCFIITMNRV